MGHVCDSFENEPQGPTTKTIQEEGIMALCRACYEQDAKRGSLWQTFSALGRQPLVSVPISLFREDLRFLRQECKT